MTNGEKIKEIFPNSKIITQYDNPFGDRFMVFTLNNEDMQVNINWWNAEYKEPTTKNDLGVDCISRTRAIERLKLNFPISQGADNSRDRHRYMQALADLQAIKELPSVTPQEPRKGHWIWCVGSHKCSNCEEYTCFSHKELLRYCPNCGADMREVEE